VTTGRPSASAYHVALIRSQLTRPHTPDGDPATEDRLLASLAADNAPFEHFLAARTEFFDTELLDTLRTGVAQVVLLGAGYDGRSFRFKSTGVRFMEVDLPATQTDKMRRLRDLAADTGHIEFAAADLTAQRIPEILSRTAYDRLSPAVFVCEGVLLYLPRPAVASLLADLRREAAPGSALLVSFAIGPPPPPKRTVSGERRQSFYSMTEAIRLLRTCGWSPVRTSRPDRTRTYDTDVALFVRAVVSA